MSGRLLIYSTLRDSLRNVKAIFAVLILALSSTAALAEDWTTNDGMFYQNVRVIRVEDDAITIIYKDGGALVPLFKLPPPLQKKFDYDPVKAKVAAEARTKADTENAHLLQLEIEAAERARKMQQIRDAQMRAAGLTNSASK
jgi:hypothetical protein